jgi:hypothetical protein
MQGVAADRAEIVLFHQDQAILWDASAFPAIYYKVHSSVCFSNYLYRIALPGIN